MEPKYGATALQTTGQHEKARVIGYYHKGISALLKSHRFILLALLGICTLLYYFGQLAELFGWKTLEWGFFYEVHDTHRLLFLAPILYACYFFGLRMMAIITAASLIVFLPRAIFMSPFPDAVFRALAFAIFAGILCSLIRIGRNKSQQYMSVKAVVRSEVDGAVEMRGEIKDEVFTAANLEVNFSTRLVKRRGQIIKLTPKEYELLSCLVRNAGKVLKHVELLRNVWGPEYGQESEYLRTFVWQLRQKIEDDPSKPQFVLTEPGVGYRFAQPGQR